MPRFLVLFLFSFSLHAAVPASPTKTELHEWMRDAFAKAEKVPAEQRRDLATALADADYDSREDEIRAALLTIALRPQFYGPFRLVSVMSVPRAIGLVKLEEITADRAAANEFIEELYRARMGTDSDEALEWQSGFADFLISAGRWKEALPLVRETARHKSETYTKVALAVLEKLNGNDAPYAAIMADCPPPPEHWAHLGKGYCAQAARSIVQRMASVGGPLPQAAQDILTGRAATTSLDSRMHGLHTLARTNPDAAEKEGRAILATPDAPAWAKDDAVELLLTIAAVVRLDNASALALSECFLTRRGAKFAPVTAETWQQLLMMPPPPPEEMYLLYGDHACSQHDSASSEEYELAGGCTAQMLGWQLASASNTKNVPAARRAIERMASVVAANEGRGLGTLAQMLWGYAKWGDTVAAQYAAQLPVKQDEIASEDLAKAVRQQTRRVSEPWTSPAQVPAAAQMCP